MNKSIFISLIILLFNVFDALSQENLINANDVTGLQVDKRLVIHTQKPANGVGPSTLVGKDSVVFGFSFITTKGSRYFSLNKIGDFGKFKTPLLQCTIGHEPAHRYAKGAIRSKYFRKVSWVIAFGGVLPFLITFYENQYFENQKVRWTGGGMMIGGLIFARLGQLSYENKIEKTCLAF